jgi:hydroxypyruvate isomerase
MNRREALKATIASAATLVTPKIFSYTIENSTMQSKQFKLKYAPHFGMFRNHAGDDPIEQLKFAADEGFTAWEDNGMMGRPTSEQERIAKAMTDLNIQMGVFVAHAEWKDPLYARGGNETCNMLQNQMKLAVETAKRVNAKWCTVVPGPADNRLDWDFQTSNVIECLKHMADICEPHGLVMVLEPLNTKRDHPGMFLTKIPQAYMICKSVNSPSCKILNDLYHQQITEGNLTPNIHATWDEIAYFQVGDNPGRNEPTTGEINYKNIFKSIHAKGFTGIIGMEHGNSQPGKEGEKALIDAYKQCDNF